VIFDNETGVGLLDGPRCREAATSFHSFLALNDDSEREGYRFLILQFRHSIVSGTNSFQRNIHGARGVFHCWLTMRSRLRAGMTASRLYHRERVIPALTDHVEDEGGVIGPPSFARL
jgi:hypothetical protein